MIIFRLPRFAWIKYSWSSHILSHSRYRNLSHRSHISGLLEMFLLRYRSLMPYRGWLLELLLLLSPLKYWWCSSNLRINRNSIRFIISKIGHHTWVLKWLLFLFNGLLHCILLVLLLIVLLLIWMHLLFMAHSTLFLRSCNLLIWSSHLLLILRLLLSYCFLLLNLLNRHLNSYLFNLVREWRFHILFMSDFSWIIHVNSILYNTSICLFWICKLQVFKS